MFVSIQPNAGKHHWQYSIQNEDRGLISTAGTTDEIIKIVDNCPSGALSYERNNKMSEQKAQPAQTQQSETTVQVNKGGPYLVKGKFVFVGTDGKEELKEGSVALCRCGGSNNKPFCDGTHRKIGFDQG